MHCSAQRASSISIRAPARKASSLFSILIPPRFRRWPATHIADSRRGISSGLDISVIWVVIRITMTPVTVERTTPRAECPLEYFREMESYFLRWRRGHLFRRSTVFATRGVLFVRTLPRLGGIWNRSQGASLPVAGTNIEVGGSDLGGIFSGGISFPVKPLRRSSAPCFPLLEGFSKNGSGCFRLGILSSAGSRGLADSRGFAGCGTREPRRFFVEFGIFARCYEILRTSYGVRVWISFRWSCAVYFVSRNFVCEVRFASAESSLRNRRWTVEDFSELENFRTFESRNFL